jgi:hypothetical protein
LSTVKTRDAIVEITWQGLPLSSLESWWLEARCGKIVPQLMMQWKKTYHSHTYVQMQDLGKLRWNTKARDQSNEVTALLGKSGNILDPSTLICLTRCVGVARIILNINFRNQNSIRVVPKGRRNIQPLRQKTIIGGAENEDMDVSHSNKLGKNELKVEIDRTSITYNISKLKTCRKMSKMFPFLDSGTVIDGDTGR